MIKQKPSISFYTFGCRLNQSETAVVQQIFKTNGYRIVDIHTAADVAVINTCTVTENGDADTRKLVNRINRINPNVKIALVGCQAQIQKQRLANLPNVRWIVGNAKKIDFMSILAEHQDPSKPLVVTPTIPKESFTIPMAGLDSKHTRANIKIQDGCDFFCSFCEIPYARGRARSRKFDDILKESQILVEGGYKELVITGINVGTYRESGRTILDVINALEQIEGLERIRISSIEPTTIAPQLIGKMAQQTKLCRHLHIPLQSGSDSVLTLMKRKYSIREFSSFIHTAYEQVPGICIGTDVIVGFPGESEGCFQTTAEYLRSSPIHYVHVFSYSKRHMAKSQNLSEVVSPHLIAQRSKILRAISARKRDIFYRSLIGNTERVLFEQCRKGLWTGLTDHYARVHVKSNRVLTNQFMNVELHDLFNHELFGNLSESNG